MDKQPYKRERLAKGDLLRMFFDLQDEYFKNYFRVNREQFQELLSLIKEGILKQDKLHLVFF